jgi:hypothetical protein
VIDAKTKKKKQNKTKPKQCHSLSCAEWGRGNNALNKSINFNAY